VWELSWLSALLGLTHTHHATSKGGENMKSKEDYVDFYISKENVEKLAINSSLPEHSFTMFLHGKEVGIVDWTTGKLIFSGDADESAKIFFDFLKNYVDAYIDEEFKRRLKHEIN
jgi:hypothetical protein